MTLNTTCVNQQPLSRGISYFLFPCEQHARYQQLGWNNENQSLNRMFQDQNIALCLIIVLSCGKLIMYDVFSFFFVVQSWAVFPGPYASYQTPVTRSLLDMMTSSNGNIFRVTGHLCGKFTGHRWISHTKASDAELWCLLWSAPEWTVE